MIIGCVCAVYGADGVRLITIILDTTARTRGQLARTGNRHG